MKSCVILAPVETRTFTALASRRRRMTSPMPAGTMAPASVMILTQEESFDMASQTSTARESFRPWKPQPERARQSPSIDSIVRGSNGRTLCSRNFKDTSASAMGYPACAFSARSFAKNLAMPARPASIYLRIAIPRSRVAAQGILGGVFSCLQGPGRRRLRALGDEEVVEDEDDIGGIEATVVIRVTSVEARGVEVEVPLEEEEAHLGRGIRNIDRQ